MNRFELHPCDITGWRLPVAIGLMEAVAFVAMAYTPRLFTGRLTLWGGYGILLGGTGAGVLYGVGRLFTSRRFAIAPVLVHGVLLLPALWIMIGWLDERYLGDFYGAPGSFISAVIASGTVGLFFQTLYPFYARQPLPSALRALLVFSIEDYWVLSFHRVWVAVFMVFESLFVFLQVCADNGYLKALHQANDDRYLLAGALTWFAWGALATLAAMQVLKRLSIKTPLLQTLSRSS